MRTKFQIRCEKLEMVFEDQKDQNQEKIINYHSRKLHL